MGILYIVATPIGNLGDITKRAIEILTSVDLILCEDTRTSKPLLNHYEIKTKLESYHKFNEIEKSRNVINKLKSGLNIALITDAGTPCISDPGSILIHEAIKEGIEIYSIPGPSALITALTLSGITLNNFAFYGFLERKNSLQRKELLKIKENDIETVVFYESPKRIVETLENIKETFDNPYIVLVNDLTKKFERKYYGNTDKVIKELNDNPNFELGEYVIVVSKNIQETKKIECETSIEGLLIDKMIKEKCTMKDAIKLLSLEYKDKYSKNEIYNASLNIKKLLK